MNLTDSYILKFQKGSPILLEDICAIYPPTLGQIVDEGYDNFQSYLSILLTEKPVLIKDDGLKKLLDNLSDFQYLLVLASADMEVNQLIKKAFFFFTREQVSFSLEPAQIIIGPLTEKHLLTEDKFQDFKQIIRKMHFLDDDGDAIIIYEDDDPIVKRTKLKMRENREKVRRAKEKERRKKKDNLEFSDLIGSVTVNNCGLNMDNIWNITYYAFHDQLKRMGWRDEFNINNRAALAGAKLKQNQLKYWMRSIANSN